MRDRVNLGVGNRALHLGFITDDMWKQPYRAMMIKFSSIIGRFAGLAGG